MCYSVFHADAVKVVYLATREDGGQNFVLLGCSQYEDGVVRGFFQCFQEGVECRCRKHVHLVDDIHLIFAYLWWDTYLFYQLTDVVDGVVGSRVQFMDIIRTLFVECYTRFAGIAGFTIGGGMHAVDGFGKDACTSGFSHTTWTAKQVGVG